MEKQRGDPSKRSVENVFRETHFLQSQTEVFHQVFFVEYIILVTKIDVAVNSFAHSFRQVLETNVSLDLVNQCLVS